MNPKFKRTRLSLLFFLLCIYSLFSYANANLETLLAPFTKIISIHFSYTEIRTSLFFKQAQISTGEIKFTKPDQISKQVLKPDIKNYKIDKNKLTIETIGSAAMQVDIDNYPQLKHFIELIKALFTGKVNYIKQNYTLTIEYPIKQTNNQSLTLWQLNLSPKINLQDLAQRYIQTIQIKGTEQQIKSIKMVGFAGEVSELTIDKILSKF